MKSIRGVVTNTRTMETWEEDIYVDIQRVQTEKGTPFKVVSLGSDDAEIQFTLKAYDIREAIRDR